MCESTNLISMYGEEGVGSIIWQCPRSPSRAQNNSSCLLSFGFGFFGFQVILLRFYFFSDLGFFFFFLMLVVLGCLASVRLLFCSVLVGYLFKDL